MNDKKQVLRQYCVSSDDDMAPAVGLLTPHIVQTFEESPRKPRYLPVPERVYARLARVVARDYPQGLYRHQAIAVDHALAGQNVILATGTASGKSLAFMISVMQTLLLQPERCAIFVYPLKALCGDQVRKLEAFARKLGPSLRVARIDGSVHGKERETLLRTANILAVTPDVLHTTMLRCNEDEAYDRIFRNLSWVVLDECHVYDGVFGSNTAYVLRRLQMVCARKGAFPQYMAASASIGRPRELIESLTGQSFSLVDESENGSAVGARSHVFLQSGYGKPDLDIASLVCGLVSQGQRFLMFCDSRKEVERIAVDLMKMPQLEGRIAPYRSGYEETDRNRLETALRNGSLHGVISTSALELGIDLPDMPVCVLMGLPTTKSRYLQRVGRIARQAGSRGTIYIMRTRSALDAFWFEHLDAYMRLEPERLRLNLQNPALMKAHYACMTAETTQDERAGLEKQAEAFFPEAFRALFHNMPDYEWMEELYSAEKPHFLTSIRAIGDPTYQLKSGRDAESPNIGNMTLSQLMREAHEGALYLHGGQSYRVFRISHSRRHVYLDRQRGNWGRTEPTIIRKVFVRSVYSAGKQVWKRSTVQLDVSLAAFSIREMVVGYTERRGGKESIKSLGKPLQRHLKTMGLLMRMKGIPGMTSEGVRGVGNALRNLLPVLLETGSDDVDVHTECMGEEATLYIYDNVAGGLNLSHGMLRSLQDSFSRVYHHVSACPACSSSSDGTVDGCPMCVQRPVAGRMEAVSRVRATALLSSLLSLMGQPVDSSRIGESQQEAFDAASRENAGAKDSNTDNHADTRMMDNHYGRLYIADGSEVFTINCRFGKVIRSYIEQSGLLAGERMYVVSFGNGSEVSFMSKSLELAAGSLLKYCSVCGADGLPLDKDACPECESQL